ncbi:recombination mediator RecR [Helicobacter cappadocius]|uniref:Recombination protein RecR n=1 Tax=Helicobacter cappadocius TaxID=3063998 RepID=A0AA90SS85_9HELI|nr:MULTISPECIES: recombination mediator RecR [unclassified Helicobacter]MDO7252771.1 recombination mediator RecR [Helicobacter sp. faydin-H75]MDP2538639.1 recombination mediator RecR [Helicobacter sp. faydin-H76]
MKNYKNSLNHFFSLIEAFEQTPSIGKKSAQKMAYNLSVSDKYLGLKIAHLLENAIDNIRKCNLCGGLSEDEICEICMDEERNNGQLCIVLHPKDIFTIEEIGDFKGYYRVIEDLENLDFETLKKHIQKCAIKEIIFAFSPTLANEAIMLYIEDKLNDIDIIFTKIAQGVPTGIGLENIDQLSLLRAFSSRVKL